MIFFIIYRPKNCTKLEKKIYLYLLHERVSENYKNLHALVKRKSKLKQRRRAQNIKYNSKKGLGLFVKVYVLMLYVVAFALYYPTRNYIY